MWGAVLLRNLKQIRTASSNDTIQKPTVTSTGTFAGLYKESPHGNHRAGSDLSRRLISAY
jgi:hypothetical protein